MPISIPVQVLVWATYLVRIPGGGGNGCAERGGDEMLQGRVGRARGCCQVSLDLITIQSNIKKDNKDLYNRCYGKSF